MPIANYNLVPFVWFLHSLIIRKQNAEKANEKSSKPKGKVSFPFRTIKLV